MLSQWRRIDWVEPGVSDALVWLILDERKGNVNRQNSLPPSIYTDVIASFLHFDTPLPNMLYAVGGRNQQNGPLDTVEMFDTWHGCWLPCPPMSTRRAGCAAAMLPDGGMCVVGGYDENGIVKGLLASCEVFNPYKQQWDHSCAPLVRARWGHGCSSLNGRIFVVGGCSLRPGAQPREAFMETLRGCEVYDAVANRWEPSADLNRARAGARVITLGQTRENEGGRYLAAVGGCDDVFGRAEMLPTLELYDPCVGYWVMLETQLSTPRTTAAVAPLDDRRVLVVGGAASLSSSEVYSVRPPRGQLTDAFNRQEDDDEMLAAQVNDMAEGRMGCQAAALWLPKNGAQSSDSGGYPICDSRCVVVVGGENGEEEDWDYGQTFVRQFNSVLVYDTDNDAWRDTSPVPPMPTPRTTTALCVGLGRLYGHR